MSNKLINILSLNHLINILVLCTQMKVSSVTVLYESRLIRISAKFRCDVSMRVFVQTDMGSFRKIFSAIKLTTLGISPCTVANDP